MISIGKLTSVEQAVRYLREAIAHKRIEYYTARGESPGRWNGAGAEALGLRGEVIELRLCRGAQWHTSPHWRGPWQTLAQPR